MNRHLPWRPHGARRLAQAVEASGLTLATDAQLPEARALASAALGEAVSPLAALRAMQARTGSAILVFLESAAMTGALGVLPLSAQGLSALLAGALDLADPRPVELAGPRSAAQALYAMGIVASTRVAARAVVTGVVRLRLAFDELAFYARAATPEGRRVLTRRLGCRRLAGTSLYASPAGDASRRGLGVAT